jgi:RNA polymerase sigma-70 factor (ECF subfamily)
LEAVFKSIYLKFFAPLCRFANFYCSDVEEAKNIVQSVFLKIWEGDKLILNQSEAAVKSYLFASVKNSALNANRKKAVFTELEAADLNISNAHEVDHAVQDLEDKIKILVQNLPERCRYVFYLSRNEEMSYKEIADLLDISTKTVENQISKALKYLRSKVF